MVQESISEPADLLGMCTTCGVSRVRNGMRRTPPKLWVYGLTRSCVWRINVVVPAQITKPACRTVKRDRMCFRFAMSHTFVPQHYLRNRGKAALCIFADAKNQNIGCVVHREHCAIDERAVISRCVKPFCCSWKLLYINCRFYRNGITTKMEPLPDCVHGKDTTRIYADRYQTPHALRHSWGGQG